MMKVTSRTLLSSPKLRITQNGKEVWLHFKTDALEGHARFAAINLITVFSTSFSKQTLSLWIKQYIETAQKDVKKSGSRTTQLHPKKFKK